MEIKEVHEYWRDYDRKISENTRLNKAFLRKMIVRRPVRKVNWMKIKATGGLLSPFLFVFLVTIMKVEFIISTRFYIGLALFLPVFLLTWLWDLRYFMLIRSVDLAKPVLTIKRVLAELEKYKIRTTRIRFLLMPVAMVGFILMIVRRFTFEPEIVTMLPLFLIIVVYFSSYYFTLNSVHNHFTRLNRDLDEIKSLEQE
jgi:hypothetical protein